VKPPSQQKARCGGACPESQLCRRQRLNDGHLKPALSKNAKLYLKNKAKKVVGHGPSGTALPSKHKILSSNPRVPKKKNKEG
jgi:hypothetical protein